MESRVIPLALFFNVSWEQRKLGDTNTYFTDGNYGEAYPKPSDMTDSSEGVPFLTGGNLKGGRLDITDASYITKEKHEKLTSGHLVEDDIVIAVRGSLGALGYVNKGNSGWNINSQLAILRTDKTELSGKYLLQFLLSGNGQIELIKRQTGSALKQLPINAIKDVDIPITSIEEQQKIGAYFSNLDHLITLHQCEPTFNKWRISMLNNINKTDLFYEYYAQWITVYKEGAIRKVTMDKYLLTLSWIKQLAPDLKVGELSRITYQQLLNDYAEKHERQTTMDFHHQIKGAILDAVDEGLIERDPTRKAIIKGKTPRQKKIKYLNQFELHKLLSNLSLGEELNWDWFILLVAKTGMRFSEALAITPKDFDFSKQSLSINKTWDYKGEGGFLPTKNQSSVRKIQIDWQLIIQFSTLVKGLPEDKPIFISDNKVYNSTVNDILTRHCKKAEIPVISVHGLRHTHASLLLFAGVSIASVAQRLGHSSMTTTQKTYLHIIQELENKDVDLVMRSLSSLN